MNCPFLDLATLAFREVRLLPGPRVVNTLEQAGAHGGVTIGGGSVVVLDDGDQGTGRSGQELTVFSGGPEDDSVGPALRKKVKLVR